MKHLRLLFVVVASVIGFQLSYGQALGTDNYYCGFKTKEEFNLWTILKLDNDSGIRTWDYQAYEPQSVCCTCNLDIESNDWLISPMLTLTQGKQHYIKMKVKAQTSQRVIFTMGQDKTAEAQTTVLLDSVFNNVSGYFLIKIPENTSGNYYFGLNYRAGAWTGNFTIYSFYLSESEGVGLNGIVTNNKENIVPNAKVSITNEKFKELEIKSNENGEFSFKLLDPGEYTLKALADNHFPFEETITIGTQNLDHPIVLSALTEFNVKGCAITKEGIPIKSAIVTLQGEKNYTTTTDENGNFFIEKVREYESYKLKIEKDLKVTYTSVVDITSQEKGNLGNIMIETLVAKPYNIMAQETDAGTILSWMLPLKAQEIRYDSGIHSGTFQITDNTELAVIGNIFDTPVLLKGASWMAIAKNETVDLYVFAINSDGSLSNQILYSVKGIKNINYKYDGTYNWNEYYFPETIEAPFGCVIALASAEKLEVLNDSGNDDGYPSTQKKCYSYDYRDGLNRRWSNGNLFIRLLGSPLGVPQLAPTKPSAMIKCSKNDIAPAILTIPTTETVTYKAWRFEIEDKENQESWTPLEIIDQKNLNYLDRSFKNLSKGTYQYAIQVVYGDGQESNIGYSNELEYKLYTNASFPVSTNIGTSYADGAIATLKNANDENIVYITTVENAKASFKHIKKGEYYLTIFKKGFKSQESDLIDLSSDDNYKDKERFNIEVEPRNPFNLKTEQSNMDVIFSWNVEEGISEDFENMNDFDVNPAGKVGWTYVDADDKQTVGVTFCQNNPYRNMYAKMAYMCFNPSMTTPDLLDYLKPHSGDKILVDVSAEEGQNNDYLFSPELSFDMNFVLSFYAKSGFFGDAGNEEFMVGYSTTEATPESVTWITTEPQAVGAAWTEFNYDIPKNAKFITIRCVSNQKFFFMLDDIYIGYKKTFVDDLANYEVYLDEELIGKTSQSQMTFLNLPKGKHIAKIQAVYTLVGDIKTYSDFIEFAFTVNDVSGIEDATIEDLYVYNRENGMITFNDAADIAAYNAQGQLIRSTKESQINVSGWQTGIYVFKVQAKGQISNYKILIK